MYRASARDLNSYLWVADPRQVTLGSGHPWPSPFGQAPPVQIRSGRICLCLSKDNFAGSKIGRALVRPEGGPRHGWRGSKVTKRNDTPEPPTPPCASRRNRRSPNSPGAEQRASGSTKSLAKTPGLARCSARSDGDGRNSSRTFTPRCFPTSRMAHPSIASLGPSARRGARGIARVARQHRDVLSGDRRARGAKRRGISRHPGRAFFGYFLCTSKESNPGCRGGATRN